MKHSNLIARLNATIARQREAMAGLLSYLGPRTPRAPIPPPLSYPPMPPVRPITIADLAPVVTIKAGDSLIVSYPRILSHEQRAMIRTSIASQLPAGITVVVIDCARLTVAKGVE